MRGPTRALLRSAMHTRRRAFVRLAGWSLVQAVPALLSGWLVARAVDDGFLAGHDAVGFALLGLLACAVLLGAWGTRRATLQLAAVVEPFRDDLVGLVVTGSLRRSAQHGRPADTAGVARLTEQVEIARESYGAVVMFVQTFAVTAVSVLLGLAVLDPALLLFVVPPLAAGLGLFLLSLRALAARQRAVVLADESVAEYASAVTAGLRDVTACGAEDLVRLRGGARIDAAADAARALARLTALRTAALGLGGWLPIVLVLAGAPWLAHGGMTAGTILGALTYVSQSLQPALRDFVHGGGSGLWLLVTLDRISEPEPETPTRAPTPTRARPAGPEARAGIPPDHIPEPGPETPVQASAPAAPARARPAGPRMRAGIPGHGGIEMRGVTFGYARGAERVVRGARSQEPHRPSPLRPQQPPRRRPPAPGVRRPARLTRRPPVLRQTANARGRLQPRPPTGRQPPRRHPPRLPQDPHPLRPATAWSHHAHTQAA